MAKTYTTADIYQHLETEIINLNIKPGAPISENELCARFGVSRTPIRTVLQRLAENGFVQIRPHKATTVTLLDYAIVDQLIYQRIAVESMVFRDFMTLASPLEIERASHLISESRSLIEGGDFVAADFYRLDGQLHDLWFDRTGKGFLWAQIQKPNPNYTRFRMMDIVEVQDFLEIIGEHEEMLALLKAKNETAIEELFRRHLYGGVRRLGELIYTDLKEYFA